MAKISYFCVRGMRIKNPNIQSSGTFFIYSLFVACLFLLWRGYEYMSGDQAEHLPLVLAKADPTLFTRDYFVPYAREAFSIRHYYVLLVYALSTVLPLSVVCFTLTMLSVAFSSWGIMRITTALSLDRLAPFISPLMVLIIFYGFTVGGNHIQYPTLISSTIAKALAMWAFVFFFERKWRLMAVFLGLASLFQVLVGLQLFMIFWFVNLITERHDRWRTAWQTLLWFVLVSAPMLMPILYRQFFHAVPYNKDLYYQILYVFRNHLHYIPSLFPAKAYYKLGGLVIATLPLLYLFRLKGDKQKIVVMMGTIVLGLILYYVMLEQVGWLVAGKLQWFKTTIWLNLLACVVISIVLSKMIQLIGHLYTMLAYLRNVVLVSVVLMILVLLNSEDIPVAGMKERYQVGRYPLGDLTKMHEWIRDNTPRDAVFLYSPDNSSFACQTQRSSLIGYKAIIHEPFFLLPWYEKFSLIYQVDVMSVGESNALEEATASYRENYTSPHVLPYDYRIDRSDECMFQDKLGPVVHRSGVYVLTMAQP
ncbi:MAG: hypothetical protein KDD36_02340 [Flavobacteriales bacterium]|nr:hypothetical protein [Flavobacteriales bacterium]